MKIFLAFLFIFVSAISSFAWEATYFDTVATYYPNGQLKEYYTRSSFSGNEKGFINDGPYISYFENGNVKMEGVYDWGKMTDCWIAHYESGNRKFEIFYVDDKLDGPFIERFEDGNIKEIGYYNLGKKCGQWTELKGRLDINNPDLSIVSMNYYLDDTLLVELEGADGDILHLSKQVVNDSLGVGIEWNRRNTIDWLNNYSDFSYGKIIDGKKVGRWPIYDKYGRLQDVRYYHDGNLIEK